MGPSSSLPPRARRWRGYLVVLALALLVHAIVLRVMPWGAGAGVDGGARPALQVRSIVLQAPAPDAARLVPAAPAVATPRKTAASTLAAPVPADITAAAAPAPEAAPAPAPAPSPADGGGERVPVFATRPAPAFAISFDMKRPQFRGEAEWLWRPRADGYTLTLHGNTMGLPQLTWASHGGFDAAGLAPDRFIDRRRGRNVLAANFQRDRARITFSSPQTEYPLVAGAQDRLSWMVQLPAIVDAAPASFGTGARIPIFVVGARGDADVWTFEVQGHNDSDGALHLVREPRRPYDTRVEVWLDPAQRHLPSRVRWLAGPVGGAAEGTEFTLKSLRWLPP